MTHQTIRRSAIRNSLTSALLVGFCCSGAPASAQTTRRVVWMDVDPAVMRGGHEPDDGLALVQAFHSPELEVRGVSAVFGNAALEKTCPIAHGIARRFGPKDLSVTCGAAAAGELGRETEATHALADALRKEPITILALGPVTNVATVLKRHPELAQHIVEIVAVAGRRPGQSFVLGNETGDPLMDFNFELDPEGFQVLLDSGASIALAPFEISSKVAITPEDVERFERGTEAARYFVGPIRDYFDWYQERFGVRAIFPYDTLAVAYVTVPQWIEREELPVEIQTHPDDVDRKGDKPYLIVSSEIDSKRRVVYCYRAAPEFKEDLMRRLLAGP